MGTKAIAMPEEAPDWTADAERWYRLNLRARLEDWAAGRVGLQKGPGADRLADDLARLAGSATMMNIMLDRLATRRPRAVVWQVPVRDWCPPAHPLGALNEDGDLLAEVLGAARDGWWAICRVIVDAWIVDLLPTAAVDEARADEERRYATLDDYLRALHAGILAVEPTYERSAGMLVAPEREDALREARMRLQRAWPLACRSCGCEFRADRRGVVRCPACRAAARAGTAR